MTHVEALLPADMRDIVDRWIAINIEQGDAEADWHKRIGVELGPELTASRRALTVQMAKRAETHLFAFLQDNRHLTADQLEEIAAELSPGGAHTGGLLVRLVRANRWDADPLLLAATIRFNWHGGKRGFQFLPDPTETDVDDYQAESEDLLELLDTGTEGDPRRVLTGKDFAFFNSLPDRFTIYRGCQGISARLAELGVCWTTQRDVAEWFAHRGCGEPVVLTARVQKADVRLVKAAEYEIVCTPKRSRQIKTRARRPDWRPSMIWMATADANPTPRSGEHHA